VGIGQFCWGRRCLVGSLRPNLARSGRDRCWIVVRDRCRGRVFRTRPRRAVQRLPAHRLPGTSSVQGAGLTRSHLPLVAVLLPTPRTRLARRPHRRSPQVIGWTGDTKAQRPVRRASACERSIRMSGTLVRSLRTRGHSSRSVRPQNQPRRSALGADSARRGQHRGLTLSLRAPFGSKRRTTALVRSERERAGAYALVRLRKQGSAIGIRMS
jgi:hypothetical protein